MINIPGRSEVSDKLNKVISRWAAKNSETVFISGETGAGKSFVVSELLDYLKSKYPNASVVRVECHQPIGKFNVAAIQPLQPFGLALEQIYLNSEKTARKRLAMNIGMSLLASVPIAGDIFYAVKAISQDVREFQKETAAVQQKKRAAVEECVQTLERIAEATPTVLLVDDGHWSDPQSVDVVRKLIERARDIPLLMIWTVNPTFCKKSNLPLTELLAQEPIINRTTHLGALSADGIKAVVANSSSSIKPTDRQVEVLQQRSAGMPGIIAEYVKYLERTNQVKADGTFADSAIADSGVKLGSHPATDVALHEIQQSDAIVLSNCAAEGNEFTAFLVAALLNTDVLSAIRLLRRIQIETGTIKSVGMRTKYGVKTTMYEFTSTVAYTYFQHYPEYEERKDIHQRIVEILTHEMDATKIDEVRSQICAYVAAHGSEADNAEITTRMLNTLGVVGEFENFEYAENSTIHEGSIGSDLNADSSTNGGAPAFSTVSAAIHAACTALLNAQPQVARTIAIEILQQPWSTTREQTILHCIAARAFISLGGASDAEIHLNAAESGVNLSTMDKVLVLNTRVALAVHNANHVLARQLLTEAMRLTKSASSPIQLLTLSNTVAVLRSVSDDSAQKFEQTVNKIARAKGWNELRKDLNLN